MGLLDNLKANLGKAIDKLEQGLKGGQSEPPQADMPVTTAEEVVVTAVVTEVMEEAPPEAPTTTPEPMAPTVTIDQAFLDRLTILEGQISETQTRLDRQGSAHRALEKDLVERIGLLSDDLKARDARIEQLEKTANEHHQAIEFMGKFLEGQLMDNILELVTNKLTPTPPATDPLPPTIEPPVAFLPLAKADEKPTTPPRRGASPPR